MRAGPAGPCSPAPVYRPPAARTAHEGWSRGLPGVIGQQPYLYCFDTILSHNVCQLTIQFSVNSHENLPNSVWSSS